MTGIITAAGIPRPAEIPSGRGTPIQNSKPKIQNRPMVSIYIAYEGDLHCEAVHGPSGDVLQTDAPTDNHGRGEAFSPTDLVATGLGTCVATLLGIEAQTRDLDLSGLRVT